MIAFSIGPIDIYWYGIMYLISFLLWYWFFSLVWKKWWLKHLPNVDYVLKNKLDDLFFAVILWVILWGRLWEILFYTPWYYIANPIKILYVWEWWMSFVGGFLWVMFSVYYFSKKNKLTTNDVLSVFDVITTFLPFAIMFWRFWNYLNQELYGLPVPDWAWGLSDWIQHFLVSYNFFHIYPQIDQLLRVNTNFLSMIFEWLFLWVLMMFLFFRYYKKWKWKAWSLTAIFMIFYAIFRFLFDYLRVDAQVFHFLWMTVTQMFSVGFVVVAGVLLARK